MRKVLKRAASILMAAVLVLPFTTVNYSKGAEAGTDQSTIILVDENFENTSFDSGISGRGATINVTKQTDGNHELAVSERTQDWQGLQIAANVATGSAITVSMKIRSGNTQCVLGVQYTQNGETLYKWIDNKATKEDTYAVFSGTYSVPADATQIYLFVQADPNGEKIKENIMVDNIKATIAKQKKSIQENLTPLKAHLAKSTTLDGKAGVAIPAAALEDEARMALVTKHFSSITAENEMKPDSFLGAKATLDENGNLVLNFASADKIMDYILEYNTKHPEDKIGVRGHVLVWHSQTPSWFFKEKYDANGAFVSEKVMLERMEYYIKNVIQHFDGEGSKYAGIIYAWDVVNEQIDGGGIRKSDGGTGISNWYQVFQGKNTYIKEAFRLANMYAPGHIKLFYNDYGETDSDKCAAICNLIKDIKSYDGARIDGMGMQAHYNIDSPAIDNFEKAVRAYAAVVGEIQLTELDFQSSSDYNGTNKTAEYTKQGYRYKAIFDKLYELDHEKGINISGVTVWGTHDSASWLQGASHVGGGADGTRKQCPLLFDDEYQAKPAYYGIVDPSQLEPFINNVTALYSKSEQWTAAPKTTYKSNNVGISFQTIWNEENIKVKVQVQDTDAAEGDKITVYLNSANSKSDKADLQKYTLERSSAVVTKQGYEGVITLPVSGMKVGTKIGLDVVVENNGVKLPWNDLKNTQATTSKYYGEVMMKPYTELSYGTPSIDGVEDAIWKQQNTLPLTVKAGSPEATANVRAMWDKDYLYVYADVTDPKKSKASANQYEQDSVEIFVDQNNGKTTAYEADDCQYRINYDNEASFNGKKCNADNLRSATKQTDTGYVVEAAIKWTDVSPEAGSFLGVDFQINDDKGTGSRAGTYNWYDDKGTGYANPSVFGTVALVKATGGNTGNEGNTGNTGNAGNTTGTNANSGNDIKSVEKTLMEAAKDSKTVSKIIEARKIRGVYVSAVDSETYPKNITVCIKDGKVGSMVYIYRVNESACKLETVKISYSERSDKNGNVTFTALEDGNYVVLTQKPASKLVTALQNQIKVSVPQSTVKVGKSIVVKTDLPACLELKEKLTSKTSNEAVGAAVVSYKISNKKLATVDSQGRIVAKKAGTVTVTTKIKLYNHKSKMFKTKIKIVP